MCGKKDRETMYNPTEQQEEVIKRRTGKVAVSAVPGSGKTATLVHRCKEIPNEHKVVLAFNKAAAEEFAKRLGDPREIKADVRTFHSFCLREVWSQPSAFGFKEKPNIYDKSTFHMVKEMLELKCRGWDDCLLDEDFYRKAEHSYYNHDLIQIKEGLGTYGPQADLMLKIRAKLVEKNILTYDSMVRHVAERRGQMKFWSPHLMVDEYQDVDRFQNDIIFEIGGRRNVKSFMVVGDPNQTIFSWRGALSNSYGYFSKCFPDSEFLPLSVNFRSVDEIVDFANDICPVGMVGVRGKGKDRPLVIASQVDIERDLIREDGTPLKELAILCRFNRNVLRWLINLSKAGIPCFAVGGTKDFFEQPHVKLAMKMKDSLKGSSLESMVEAFSIDPDWIQMHTKMKYDTDEKKAEALSDVEFVFSLKTSDMLKVIQSYQSTEGIRISTVHRTKGMEFKRTILYSASERERDLLRSEKCVNYVASTRAKDALIIV